MASVAVLPRTVLHRTRWGTAIFYNSRQGLLARSEAGRWCSFRPEELQRGYPEAYAAWLRFAAIPPASASARVMSQRGGGDHAS